MGQLFMFYFRTITFVTVDKEDHCRYVEQDLIVPLTDEKPDRVYKDQEFNFNLEGIPKLLHNLS